MDNNDETGGRVTRSLRKRLTSVDSDVSSRPGTPVQVQKLTSITEMNSATPRRTTRRNSITGPSTPVKTPAKSKATSAAGFRSETPDLGTPARRTTRRRSTSTIEDAHTPAPVKTIKQEPHFDALPEEDVENDSKLLNNKTPPTKPNDIQEKNTSISLELPQKRVTRSSSKSPQNLTTDISPSNSKRGYKPGPKSKTRFSTEEVFSDVEVIDLDMDDDMAQISEENNLKQIQKVPHREEGRKSNDKKMVNQETKKSEETMDIQNEVVLKNKTDAQINDPIELLTEASDNEPEGSGSDTNNIKQITELHKQVDNSIIEIITKDETSPHKKMAGVSKVKECDVIELLDDTSDLVEDKTKNTKLAEHSSTQKPINPISSVMITEVLHLDDLSPMTISKLVNSPTKSAPVKNQSQDGLQNVKAVAFNDCSDETIVKNVYPRTPGHTKSKSYIDVDSSKEITDKSFQSECDGGSLRSFKGFEEVEIPETQEQSLHFSEAEVDGDEFAAKTPHKSKLLKNMPSSTPKLEVSTNEQTTQLKSVQIDLLDVENVILSSPEKSLRSGKKYGESPLQKSPKKSPNAMVKNEKRNSSKNVDDDENSVSSTVPESKEFAVMHQGTAKVDVAAAKSEVFARSWPLGVSGKANVNSKIDTIEPNKSPLAKIEAISDIAELSSPVNNKPIIFSHQETEVSTDDEHIVEDDDEDDDEEDEDIPNEKHAFLNIEAMDAGDDYQSGDSMDEDERRELEENELIEHGESIGSTDTEEEHDEVEDDENNSFIVSDGEEQEILNYSDDDEHLEDVDIKEHKVYKRLRMPSTSESENEKEENIDNDCVINQALALEVSKMIDETLSDEEIMKAGVENGKPSGALQEALPLNKIKRKSLNKSKTCIEECMLQNDDLREHSFPVEKDSDTKIWNKSQLEIENTNHKTDNFEKQVDKKNKSLNQRNSRNLSALCNETIDADTSIKQNLNVSKLSESALQLQQSVESDSTEDEKNVQQLDASRKSILGYLNKSERFNKTVHELDTEQTSPEADAYVNKVKNSNETSLKVPTQEREEKSEPKTTKADKLTNSLNKSLLDHSESNEDVYTTKNHKSLNTKACEQKSADEENSESEAERKSYTDSQEDVDNYFNISTRNPTVSRLGEVSIDKSDDDASVESYDELSEVLSHKKGLSVSFGNLIQKIHTDIGQTMHKSFTIGVSVTNSSLKRGSLVVMAKGGVENDNVEQESSIESNHVDIATGHNSASDLDENERGVPSNSDISSAHTSANYFEPNHKLSSDDEEHLQRLTNIQKLPNQMFGKSQSGRRQSLAFSGSSSIIAAKKLKRNSFHLPNDEDLSSSFIESVAEHKRQQQNLNTKRKRLSTSLCVASNSLDTTEHDLVRHLHKKSKVQNSEGELKKPIIHSSTPRPNSSSVSSNDDNNNIQRILGRCDEIIEAANRAKLEAKINFKKSIVKLQKKKRVAVKSQLKELSPSLSTKVEEITVPRISKKELKRQEQHKEAVEQALKASAKILLHDTGKKKTALQKIDEEQLEKKCLPLQVIRAISNSEPPPSKKNTKDFLKQPALRQVNYLKSTAGNVLELPLTPTKKKKSHKTIQLASGPVLVEPATPTKKQRPNGFRESPLTPRTTGFKVRQLSAGQDTIPVVMMRKDRKRKRNVEEPKHTLPQPKWTQSGLFMEENLPTLHATHKSKKSNGNGNFGSFGSTSVNFKNSAMFRNEIPREGSREVVHRKERYFVNNQF